MPRGQGSRRAVCISCIVILMGPMAWGRLFAQEATPDPAIEALDLVLPVLDLPPASAVPTLDLGFRDRVGDHPRGSNSPDGELRRPAALLPIYISFAALQVLDVHSTLRGVDVGGSEMNPIVGGVGLNAPAQLAMKGAATAGVIYLSERLWKRQPMLAIVTMLAVDFVTLAIVANNYRVGTVMDRHSGAPAARPAFTR